MKCKWASQAGFSIIALAALASSCNSGNNARAISPESFVNQLVELAGYSSSKLAKGLSNQPGYFVIWDSEDQKYLAVNLLEYNSGTLVQGVNQFVQKDLSNPASAGIIVTPAGSSSSGVPIYESSNGTVYSMPNQTKDVDLMQARVQTSELQTTAVAISAGFQMSFASAMQLATLADRVNSMGPLSVQDREAVTASLAGIAGLTSDELNQAIEAGISGNTDAVNALIDKAAHGLGMPSGATLRQQILAPMGLSN